MSDKKKNYDVLEFSNQAKFFIEKYFKLGLALAVIGIACSAAWVGMKKMETQKEQEAFTSLFAITNEYNTIKEGFDKADAQDKNKAAKKPENKKDSEEPKEKFVKATGDIDKDYGEVVRKLESFLSSNKGMQASGEASLTLSSIYEKYDKKEQAAAVLTQTLQSWKGTGLLLEIMRMRAGDLWSMNNQCDKAVAQWEKLANKDNFLTPQAQLRLGLCYQKLGKIDLARTWLQKVTSKNAESPAGFSAKKYLRYLDFEKSLKKENTSGKTADEEKTKKEKAS